MIYTAPIELYDIMESVVDSMRETAGIGLIVADGDNWKYPATNTLSKHDYISITDDTTTWENQLVIEATSTYFILADYHLATSFKANAPYFMCEKEQKAAIILTEKSKQDTYSWQKYPLFLLTRPYTDDRTSETIGYSVDFNLHVIYNTKTTYWANDRISNNFTPILYPLYVEFMNKIVDNRWIKEKDPNKITHDKTDLLLVSNTSESNPFPDALDGITIAFSDLEVLKNVTPCQAEELEQFNLVLSSTVGGSATSSVSGEGTILVNKDTNVAAYATANPGYKFSQWLRNGIVSILNPYAFLMTQNINLVAEFIVSLIKQLTISVSGIGTTNPIPGNYDIESGNSQLIEAIETDADYIFEKFDQDGTETTANPGNFTVIENSLVVAYFVLKWIQWIFGTTIQKVVDRWYFIDQGINGNNVQVKNTQIGTFNGSVYLAMDMAGRTIASYESDGLAIPTKTSDLRIDVTAGSLYSITTDDGYTAYFNEGDQDCIFFSDGVNVIEATLENVVLSTFWANKSEFGTSGNIIKGYTKYLNTITAGITALDVTGGTGTPIAAYGEWKGTFWRNSAIASDYLAFISNGTGATITNQGYVLFLFSGGGIWIRKGVTGAVLLSTANAYLDLQTYYEYLIQRNETENQYFTGAANAFRLLIKGGSFTEFTVVDTTGGSGSNPFVDSTYTTYKYQSFNLTGSTMISHQKKDDIKIDVEDFQTVSGAFGVQSAHGLDDGLTDAKGNELEIPKNVVSNSGNTFDGIQKAGIETGATYDDVYAITADANTEITKTANKSSGYVSELKIF